MKTRYVNLLTRPKYLTGLRIRNKGTQSQTIILAFTCACTAFSRYLTNHKLEQ